MSATLAEVGWTAATPAAPVRVVLDTNVIMALWHFADPRLFALKRWLETGAAIAITRGECLDELQRVLAYSQFAIEPARQQDILNAYLSSVECLPVASESQLEFAETLPRCKDRDDQKFISLAWDAAARILITRDKLLLRLARRPRLRERFAIVTPERVCQNLSAAHGS